MALITCPHCGKSVSDSVDACIHCGGSLKEKSVPEQERFYAALPLVEQKSLRTEFEQKYPAIAESDRRANKLGKILLILCIIFSCIAFIGLSLLIRSIIFEWWTGAIIGAVMLVFGVAVAGVLYYYIDRCDTIKLKNMKRYQVWLKQDKNVKYSVTLNKNDRKKFEQIKLD